MGRKWRLSGNRLASNDFKRDPLKIWEHGKNAWKKPSMRS